MYICELRCFEQGLSKRAGDLCFILIREKMSITLPRLIFTLSFVSLYDFLISNSNCIPKSTIVFYNDTVTIRRTQFCFSPSTNFRCSEKEEVIIPSNDTIITCCPGFQKIEENGVIKCRCSKCPVSNMRCDADSEKCVCEDGWIGEFCDNPCPKLYFGPGCEKKCDSGPNTFDCDHVTGRQLCFPGFFGDRCENPCPKGIYCVDGKFCKSPGDCQCPPGRNGTFCEIKVLQDEEGPSCNNAGEWDNDRGRCICKPGWQGKICEKRCDHGYYGTDCSTKCPTPSKQSHISRKTSSCDPATGFYKCEVGFKGKICDRCMTCDCPPGYKGNNCDELCEEGRYGINCHQICSCENNATCSPFDGTCTCLAGWSGEKCGDACQSGYYGINCTTRCDFEGHSKECHHITGELVCSPGYIGPFCNETCPCGKFEKDCPESCETRRSLKSSAQTGTCLNNK